MENPHIDFSRKEMREIVQKTFGWKEEEPPPGFWARWEWEDYRERNARLHAERVLEDLNSTFGKKPAALVEYITQTIMDVQFGMETVKRRAENEKFWVDVVDDIYEKNNDPRIQAAVLRAIKRVGQRDGIFPPEEPDEEKNTPNLRVVK